MSRDLHAQLMVVDAMEVSAWDRETLEELRAGGVSCVVVTCALWEGAREALDNLARWYRTFREHADLVLPALHGTDVDRAKETGRTAVVLGFQNASPLEDDIALVEVFHRLGVRVIQLTYNNQNHVGSGCYEASDGGLSRFGRLVVAEMNRLGIVVDLSHCGEATCLEAIEASHRPVAITHANPHALYPTKRNKSTTVLKALAEHSGMLGLTLYPHLMGGSQTTLDAFCAMVARAADVMGIDNVGIGSDAARKCTDADLRWMRAGRWTSAPEYGAGRAGEDSWPTWPGWFGGPADFPNLTAGLLAHGFAPGEVAAIMGGNWRRFFGQGFEPE